MEAPFKVGEILIFQNATSDAGKKYEGEEVELIGGWALRQCGRLDHIQKKHIIEDKMCYRIRMPDNVELNCQPHQLRRKKPPQDDKQREIDKVVSWEDCGWNPHRTKVTEPA